MDDKIDFDKLKELYEGDPVAFEKKKHELFEKHISNFLPEKQKEARQSLYAVEEKIQDAKLKK